MVRNLALAFALIVLLAGVLFFVASRPGADNPEPSTHASESHPDAANVGPVSQTYMPEGYRDVALEMTLAEIRHVHPRVVPEPTGTVHPDGYQVWYEDDAQGARAMYLLDPKTRRVAQVQFASQIPNIEGIPGRLRELSDRYGVPSGAWDCPDSEQSSAVRRFTWRHTDVSVMVAILVHDQRAALTLIIAPTANVATSLRRAQCQPLRSPDQLDRFPIASGLRGDRSTVILPITPDE